MVTSQISKQVSQLIRERLDGGGIPHFEATIWGGISPAKLSNRLSCNAEWTLPELTNFSEQVFGMPLSSLLIELDGKEIPSIH